MKNQPQWIRIIYIIGVVALIIGALDPMEGSVLIALGALLTTITTFIAKDRHYRFFLVAGIMILFSVAMLWYVSALGGFDPKKQWWWLIILIPYPVGWLMEIILLIVRAFSSPEKTGP